MRNAVSTVTNSFGGPPPIEPPAIPAVQAAPTFTG